MQTSKHDTEAPDRCRECDAEDWLPVKLFLTGDEARLCQTCEWVERRCRTGHWVAAFVSLRDGFCAPCIVRRRSYA